MNTKQRLEALEKVLPSGEVLTPREMQRWFLMFAEQRGTGHATYRGEEARTVFTPEDWKWYEETTARMNVPGILENTAKQYPEETRKLASDRMIIEM